MEPSRQAMTTIKPDQQLAYRYRRAGTFLVAAIALLAGTTAYMIARDGMRIWATARQNTYDAAIAIGISLTGLLEQSTYSLRGLGADLRQANRRADAATLGLLRNVMRQDPLSAYLGVKTDGRVLAIDHAGAQVSEPAARALAAAIPTGAGNELKIEDMIQLPTGRDWFMPLTLNAGGDAGITFALVPAARLEAVLTSLKVLPGSGVSISSADGRRLIRQLDIGRPGSHPTYNGGHIPDWELRLTSAQLGRAELVSPINNQKTIFGWSRSATVPFQMVTGISENLLYTEWLRTSLAPGVVLFIGTLGIVIFGVRLRQALLHQQRYLRTQEYLASHDSLTGLLARHSFMQHLGTSIDDSPELEFAVVLMDLNNFKDINDTLGHAAGDEVLKVVAHRLLSLLDKPQACVARLGGDELAIYASRRSFPQHLEEFCAAVQGHISQKIVTHGVALETGASMGVAMYPQDAGTPVELLRRADIAMYAAKAERKTFVRYSGSMDIFTADALALRSDFAQAIRDRSLSIAYQPKVDLATGNLVGVEALSRWAHPTRGMVPPAEFIPLAEGTELVYPFTDFVLGTTIAQAARWLAMGRAVPVAVNISANNLLDNYFGEKLQVLLEEFRLPPELLELEITESAVMRHPDVMIRRLQSIRDLGVKLSIDDFGTGYASLSYLKKLPVNALKIDRSFIAGLEGDDADRRIVKSAISLGHEFGMTVIAEGVETAEVAALLREFHCDIAQGYHFARPLPASEIESGWLQQPAAVRS
jgi:diguanylate cyclase (GGDEF)-like protein